MHARAIAIPAIAAALITTACNTERDAATVKVEQAYALGINSAMGGMVEPDRFQIHVSAFEDGHHTVKPATPSARQSTSAWRATSPNTVA